MTNTLLEPVLNLMVIRSDDIDRAVLFYEQLGLVFIKQCHQSGPEHYSAEIGPLVFEIYPVGKNNTRSTGTRLGFKVSSIDKILENIERLNIHVVSPVKITEWGRQVVVEDYDGHIIEITE